MVAAPKKRADARKIDLIMMRPPIFVDFSIPSIWSVSRGLSTWRQSRANFKLATAGRIDAEKLWYLDLSAGQAAAAIKAEARGLSYDFDVVHPELGAAPAASGNRHSWAWRVS